MRWGQTEPKEKLEPRERWGLMEPQDRWAQKFLPEPEQSKAWPWLTSQAGVLSPAPVHTQR